VERAVEKRVEGGGRRKGSKKEERGEGKRKGSGRKRVGGGGVERTAQVELNPCVRRTHCSQNNGICETHSI
jgi:hypothetical protein